ncbi:MAG: hypothetical protein H7840_15620 [Alphaproteobacteria bacterium]
MRISNFVAAILLSGVVASTALAEQLDLEAITAQPGTEVIKQDNGLWTISRGGVVISQYRMGDKIEALGVDNSGHGAVMCMWGLYVDLKTTLDYCLPDKFGDLKEELSVAIGQINDFIVQNSLTKVSPADIEGRIAKQEDNIRKRIRGIPRDELEMKCVPKGMIGIIENLQSTPREKFKASIANLLSVPRPPVMNPCL